MSIKDKADVDIRTAQEIAEDERVNKLMETLSSLQAGNRVIIERLRPSWCKGQLETLTVGPEGLDLEYLIRTWGGDVLSLKVLDSHGKMTGSITVELYSWPTRRLGKIIKDPKFQDDEENSSTPAIAPTTQTPAAPASPLGTGPDHFMRMLELLNAQRQSEVETLRSLLVHQMQNQTPPTTPAATSGASSIRDMAAMFKAFGELREVVQGDLTPPGEAGEQLPGQVMNLLQMFLAQKANEPKPQLTGPVMGTPPPARPAQRSPILPGSSPAPILPGSSPAPFPAVQVPDEKTNVTNLRAADPLDEQLAALPPDQAAHTLIAALARMPSDKREAALGSFMQEFNDTMATPDDRFDFEYEDAAQDEEQRGVERDTTG